MGDVDIFFMVSSVYNIVGGEIRFRMKYLRIDARLLNSRGQHHDDRAAIFSGLRYR